jgi:hypothetical protein
MLKTGDVVVNERNVPMTVEKVDGKEIHCVWFEINGKDNGDGFMVN